MAVSGPRTTALILFGTVGILHACNPQNRNQLDCLGKPCPDMNSSSSVSAANPARTSWQEIETEMRNACGGCHDINGPSDMPFLAGPDHYRSIVGWPGIVTTNPERSTLLTHAMLGMGHSGKNLDAPNLVNTLLPKVKTWLDEEAKNFTKTPENVGSHIDPFVPVLGFNAKYLDPFGLDFQGIAITFTATLTGPSMLELSDIQVHPTAKTGVRIAHPIVVVHAIGKAPEPVDSLGDGEQIFEASQFGPLGPGIVVLTNWSVDAKLSLAFENIDIYDSLGPADYGCRDLAAFEAHARPQVVACLNCHGGANSNAVAAVDMTGLLDDNDATAIAIACGQIRNRVNPASAQSSILFITTDPGGNAAHPYKFLGSNKAFRSFRDSVSRWIEAEQ